ncbi:MAG TPA: trypsin-like peptidase domain-containing protein [Bauldia sp.]|nr:trypsin-like peptidase domain-containing protein [Bauldia sp.]
MPDTGTDPPGKRRVLPTALALSLLAVFAGPPALGADGRPGIIGKDDRVPLTAEGPPWDAVGQVNIGGFRTSGQCTGTLVAPRMVVTAAHCVINPATGRPHPLNDTHFLAAVRGSDHKGHATARCLRFAHGHALAEPDGTAALPPDDKVPLTALAADAAVIVLNADLEVAPAPVADGASASPGSRLTHVAYPSDRRFLPVVHQGCLLIRADPNSPFWLNDCDTIPGSSGGPILVDDGGTYKVAAIQVAAGSSGANVALPLPVWSDLIRDTGCP